MNIICSKQKLQDGISIVTKAITGKTTMPVLEGIYIQATKEGLTLIGSDMDVSIKTKVEAEVLKEGSIVIDSKIFSEIIRKLPNSDVKIEISENDLVQISCEKSVFNVVFMNAADYPSLPSINEELSVEVPQNLLKNMIKGTSFAIAQDEARPILQGILFEVKVGVAAHHHEVQLVPPPGLHVGPADGEKFGVMFHSYPFFFHYACPIQQGSIASEIKNSIHPA